MSELKPCPFCGEQVFTPLVSSLDDGYTRCISCGAKMQRSRWQARPIEDELRKRIAELTECIGSQMADVYTLKARIAELEEMDRMRSEIVSTLNQTNANNEDEIELLKKRIAKLKEKNETLKTACDILRSDNNLLFKRLMSIETPDDLQTLKTVYGKEDEMSVSEHANYLLNEYGRLQFDYAFLCKPDGESLRNEARNNLEEYIAELEAERRWRIIADGEMPEDRATVLVAFTEYPEQIDILTATYYKHYEGFGGVDNWWNIEGWHSGNVTHWMPLPELPEVK